MLLLGVAVGCSSTDDSESNGEDNGQEPITLGVIEWTSTAPPTKIAKSILEDMGYEVEEIDADTGSVYTGLSGGDIDVFMDSWLPAHDPYLEKYEDTIEETAESYGNATSGWVVPSYMEDVNSIDDIKGIEDEFDNELYAIEEGTVASEGIDEAIETYDVDLEQINSSEGAMMAMAIKKMDKKEPVVFWGWRPHTMFSKFDIKILEDPKELFDVSSVHVITNKELQETAPDAYEFLNNWNIPIEDMEEMIEKIEDGEDSEEVAQEWIDNNQDKVQEMKGE